MLSRMRHLWANLFHKARRDQELEAEVAGYVEMLAAEKMRAGMSADEARRAAMIEAGGVEQVKESVRDVRTGARLETFWQDIRYGLRMLARAPGFTAVAVLTLALGIGANTAIFSLVDAVLFRVLPYEAPDRLVIVSELAPGNRGISVAYANYLDWKAQNQSFERLAICNSTGVIMQAVEGSDRLSGWMVSADFLRTLGVPVSLGRDFSGEDERSAAPVVLITDGLWKTRFGSDPAVINSAVTIDGKACTVIGVLPSSFRAYFSFSTPPEILIPFAPYVAADPKWLTRSNHNGSSVIARLKSGVSLERARADLKAVAARLEQQYPDTNAGNSVLVQPIMEDIAGDIRAALLILLAAVGAVLLIACTNLANLQLARSSIRSGEIAVRIALGARRSRVLRQLLTESVLLSALGGTLGIFLAMWCVDAVVKANPRDLPRLDAIAVNGRVLVFTMGLSVLTGILFGLLPAWQASSGKANVALKEVGRSGGLTRGGRRIGNGLVVAEIALSMLLLVCAGLLIRSFVRLRAVNPGFNPHGVLTFRLAPPDERYPTDDRRVQFYEAALERIRALPGVEAGGGITPLPMAGGGWQHAYHVEGHAIPKNKQFPSTDVHFVTPDYFRVMQIPLLCGRLLAEADRKGVLPVVVINETAAQRLWPNQDAVGKRIRTGAPLDLMSADEKENPWWTVVGVVGDVHQYGLERAFKTEIYFPASQRVGFLQTITVRTSVPPLTLAEPIRRTISGLDPKVPIFRLATMEEYVSSSLDSRRLLLVLMLSFAAVAMLLAAIGIYGLISYGVSQRTREIGVRMALGASRGDVLRMVLGQSVRLLAGGAALGLLASALASAVLRTQLYGVASHDPATFIAVSVLLVLLAMLASYIPARRAMRVEPMAALRYE
jgi:putative ABC transport system permease protein